MSLAQSFIHLPSRLRASLYRWLSPIIFSKLGKKGRIHAGFRTGRLFSNIAIGSEAVIKYSVFMQTGRTSSIRIGDGCMINSFTHIVASENITIGDGVAIAERVTIRDQEHLFGASKTVRGAGFRTEAITIGDNCWIGCGAYIGPGTKLGNGVIIGANSVVRGEFPSDVVIAGAPAKIVKHLRQGD